MRVEVLGITCLTQIDGTAVPLARGRLRALLALLALHRTRAVTVDEAVDELWESPAPATVGKALQGLVVALRKAAGAELVRTEGASYRLGPVRLDVDAVEANVATARELLAMQEVEQARRTLRTAQSMFRGSPYEDLPDCPDAAIERARLDAVRATVTDLLVDVRLAAGEHLLLVPDLEATVARDPLAERHWRQLALALYRSGRPADALAACRRGMAALDEMGLEPSADLREAELAVLRHSPILDLPPPRRLDTGVAPREVEETPRAATEAADLDAVLGVLSFADTPLPIRLIELLVDAGGLSALELLAAAGMVVDGNGAWMPTPEGRRRGAAWLADDPDRPGSIAERRIAAAREYVRQLGAAKRHDLLVAAVPAADALIRASPPAAGPAAAELLLDLVDAYQESPHWRTAAERARALRPNVPPRLAAQLDVQIAGVSWHDGDAASAHRLTAAVLEQAEETGDVELRADALHWLSLSTATTTGEVAPGMTADEAVRLAERSVDAWNDVPGRRGRLADRSSSVVNVGVLHWNSRHDLATAREVFGGLLGELADDDTYARSVVLWMLTSVLIQLGELDLAEELLETAERIPSYARSQSIQGRYLRQRAALADARGHLAEATELLRVWTASLLDVGYEQQYCALQLISLGDVRLRLGQVQLGLRTTAAGVLGRHGAPMPARYADPYLPDIISRYGEAEWLRARDVVAALGFRAAAHAFTADHVPALAVSPPH